MTEGELFKRTGLDSFMYETKLYYEDSELPSRSKLQLSQSEDENDLA